MAHSRASPLITSPSSLRWEYLCFSRHEGNASQTWLGIASILGGFFGVFLFLHTVRIPITPHPPLPRLVRISFVVFIIALVIVGGQMVLRRPNVLPWDLTETTSVIYGWMFLGAALYFAYTLVRPSWHNAGGQLAGFLAYDLVLILPFLQRMPTIQPQYQLSQMVYLAVVIYSGALAIYYLFIKPQTRLSRIQQPAISDVASTRLHPKHHISKECIDVMRAQPFCAPRLPSAIALRLARRPCRLCPASAPVHPAASCGPAR